MANTNNKPSGKSSSNSSPVVVVKNGSAANIIIDKSGVYIPQLNGNFTTTTTTTTSTSTMTKTNGGSVQISIQKSSAVETRTFGSLNYKLQTRTTIILIS